VTVIDRATAAEAGWRGGPLFHGERLRRLGPRAWLLRLDTLRAMVGFELPNAPGALRVEALGPVGQVSVARLPLPAVYRAPVYRAFPCNHYARVWRRSYTARRCLAFWRDLSAGQMAVFVTRLTPVPADPVRR
jgi:hypothetical protein